MTTVVESSARYRFRIGEKVSPWMTAEALQRAAMEGTLTLEGFIQPIGHDSWTPAAEVKGLVFPKPVQESDEEQPETRIASAVQDAARSIA